MEKGERPEEEGRREERREIIEVKRGKRREEEGQWKEDKVKRREEARGKRT